MMKNLLKISLIATVLLIQMGKSSGYSIEYIEKAGELYTKIQTKTQNFSLQEKENLVKKINEIYTDTSNQNAKKLIDAILIRMNHEHNNLRNYVFYYKHLNTKQTNKLDYCLAVGKIDNDCISLVDNNIDTTKKSKKTIHALTIEGFGEIEGNNIKDIRLYSNIFGSCQQFDCNIIANHDIYPFVGHTIPKELLNDYLNAIEQQDRDLVKDIFIFANNNGFPLHSTKTEKNKLFDITVVDNGIVTTEYVKPIGGLDYIGFHYITYLNDTFFESHNELISLPQEKDFINISSNKKILSARNDFIKAVEKAKIKTID